jgi:hypothetical protein
MSVAPIRWNYKITTNWHDCLSPSLTPSHGGGCPIGPHSGPSYMYDVIVIDFLYIFFLYVYYSLNVFVCVRPPQAHVGAFLYWKSPVRDTHKKIKLSNFCELQSKTEQKRYNLCLPKRGEKKPKQMWPGRKLLGIIKKGKDDEYIL